MRALVTGGAGFIGSTLVDRLLAARHDVVIYDNFSTGQRDFVAPALVSPLAELVEGDVLNLAALTDAIAGCDVVFHLAANADVRFGTEHPGRDLQQNTVATFTVLEAMRAAGVKRIAFSSTGSVYGEPATFPTPENAPFPIQTSLYGASKLAGESLIAAYSEGFGFEGFVFRFVSILGERYTHGHVFDFSRSLLRDPSTLQVLGNGKQRKSYCTSKIASTRSCWRWTRRPTDSTFSTLARMSTCQVKDSIGWITSRLGLSPELEYSGGDRGWIGDSPFIFLDCTRIRALGWKPTLTIQQAVFRTVDYLLENKHLMDLRS